MKNTIVNELSNSLKSGDKTRIHTLRLILAAIKDKEIASRSNGENDEISSDVVSGLLKKMIKQRNDSIEMFEKANRQELVQKEQEEVKIISEFLPAQLDEEQTVKVCEEAISQSDAQNLKDIGKVIKLLKEKHSDSLDMSIASRILKEKLK
tara:strand:- start:2909 stop:3361 length:453 start_codon:yes stop_codon:yes gene_type:complete